MRNIGLMLIVSSIGSALAYEAYNLYWLMPNWVIIIILIGTSIGINRAGRNWRTQQWWRTCLICLALLYCPVAASLLVEVCLGPQWSWTAKFNWPKLYTNNPVLAVLLPNTITIDKHNVTRLVLADVCGWCWGFIILRWMRKPKPV